MYKLVKSSTSQQRLLNFAPKRQGPSSPPLTVIGSTQAIETIRSERPTREFSNHRVIKCALAWGFALLTLTIAIYGVIRYQAALAANIDWPIMLKLKYVFPPVINRLMLGASASPMVTSALLVAILWYLWFEAGSDEVRAKLFLRIGAAIAAVVLSRVLQFFLPLHLRPLHDPIAGFEVPPGIDPSILNNWGSFPSDHACLLFAIVYVIWRQSPALGAFSLFVALYNNVPRIYFGLHYPTDIVFGALLGIMVVTLIENFGPEGLARRAILFQLRKPGLFYFFGFMLSYEVASLFVDVRKTAVGLVSAFRLTEF